MAASYNIGALGTREHIGTPSDECTNGQDMATLYETFRVHGWPLWSMLPATISIEIFNLPFRFDQDPKGNPSAWPWSGRPPVCMNTMHKQGPENIRGRRPVIYETVSVQTLDSIELGEIPKFSEETIQ